MSEVRYTDGAAAAPLAALQLRDKEIADLQRQLAEMTAAHVNMVAINRALRDRPDLKERADGVQELTQRAERAEALCEQLRDAAIDKIMAMSDEQIKALCAFEGHHPEDESRLSKQAIKLAIMVNKLRTTEASLSTVRAETKEECAKVVPTTWLDPLLTGPRKVIGDPPWGCPDVEKLLRAIAAAIRALPGEGKL